jgi:uncharacterized protein (TIGR03435 family)
VGPLRDYFAGRGGQWHDLQNHPEWHADDGIQEGSGLTELSGLLSLMLDRQAINKNGVAGKFDIHLRFSPDQLTAGQHGSPADTPEAPDGPWLAWVYRWVQL